jgi:protein-tyrosine kinase
MSIIEKAVRKLEKELSSKADKALIRADSGDSVDSKFPEIEENKNKVSDRLHPDTAKPFGKYIDIDIDRLNKIGIVTPSQGKTQIAEQFRIIKRPLLTNVFNKGNKKGKNINLIMLSSALAGEGKSFCAVNLAMSIASEMDHRVLLIDADVARPSIPDILGFGTEKGLLDLLLDEKLGVCDVLIKTSVEKLNIITAGTKHSHATELLASQGMELLLDELAQRYDDRIVIFDSPPLLLTSEARVLAARMGQIILVVEAERTTQQAVQQTLDQLESRDNVNLIYNKERYLSGSEYYGYYYS